MNEYRAYAIEITLKSPIVTQFQSDTIFGHICWAIRFLKWGAADKLGDFLDSYDTSEAPPLLISNGFPKGYLPKPIIPPITQKELEGIIGRKNRIRDSFKVKTIKNTEVIPKEDFLQLHKGKITPLKLFEVIFSGYERIREESNRAQSMIVQHNTVNRVESRVTRGLYSQEEVFFEGDSGKFEIYLKTYYFTRDDLQRIFDYIKDQGFGRDKSTGKGYFNFKIKEGIELQEPETPNAFMTLSSYVPNEKDPTDGHYNILLKYGKLGGLYAKGVLNRNPFKKPLIMFSAGSTFYDSAYYKGKTYGSLLGGVHHNDSIRHYACAFPLGINI